MWNLLLVMMVINQIQLCRGEKGIFNLFVPFHKVNQENQLAIIYRKRDKDQKKLLFIYKVSVYVGISQHIIAFFYKKNYNNMITCKDGDVNDNRSNR